MAPSSMAPPSMAPGVPGRRRFTSPRHRFKAPPWRHGSLQYVFLLAAAMTDFVKTAISQRTGVITLDRPRALNALSLSMIRALSDVLLAWRDDPAIDAVCCAAVPTRPCARVVTSAIFTRSARCR